MYRGYTPVRYTGATECSFPTTVTDGPALNALAHLGDTTRALGPSDVRVLHRIHARTTIRIDEVHARRLDIDEHLTGTRLRGRNLTELEHLKRAGRSGGLQDRIELVCEVLATKCFSSVLCVSGDG